MSHHEEGACSMSCALLLMDESGARLNDVDLLREEENDLELLDN